MSRAVSLLLIVGITFVSTGALCVLPCEMTTPDTGTVDAAPATHCQATAASTTTTGLTASTASCGDRDGLSPAVETAARRIVNVDTLELLPADRTFPQDVFGPAPRASSSPPGSRSGRVRVALRI